MLGGVGKGDGVGSCLIMSRRVRPDPERGGEDRERDRHSPSLVELCRGGCVQKPTVNHRPKVCTVLYTLEIIAASHLLSSYSAKQILSSLFY